MRRSANCCNGEDNRAGNIVIRSFAPLPERTTIVPARKSRSCTRSATHSPTRIPLPYNSAATSRGRPRIAFSAARTSSGDSTSGNRCGRRTPRRRSSKRVPGPPSTSRCRNNNALIACRCELVATSPRSTR
jgi:hypothetical protein